MQDANCGAYFDGIGRNVSTHGYNIYGWDGILIINRFGTWKHDRSRTIASWQRVNADLYIFTESDLQLWIHVFTLEIEVSSDVPKIGHICMRDHSLLRI